MKNNNDNISISYHNIMQRSKWFELVRPVRFG